MYDFECQNGHIYEVLVPSYIKSRPCNECGVPSNRMISAVRCKLEAATGDFPSALNRWERNREKMMEKKRAKTNS